MTRRLQRIQRNGLVTIPKEIRDKLNIQEGDYIEIELHPEGLRVRLLDIIKDYRKLHGLDEQGQESVQVIITDNSEGIN